ncbi:hypothetical protein IE53DRAFT_388798 [Violaceomyces palustris]|uniref:Uncharacterized protein n=1 Tax=Violaceomyces palustris TaxID=1673888 RepID=A0ACD0NT65_9BASI|nr:hypothetical protein IE53DRAFT_388798 [Violaceomyces palustris]
MSTDRLRKRLQEADDRTLSQLKENFCMIGTPLPALDEKKKDHNELKPVWQQEVRDEQGRRRFHGAFTGGFSAGYFNTVGSKEGWTPSTFRSSRKDKIQGEVAKPKQSRPEDFMDEEDLAELKESRFLKSSDDYAASSLPAQGRDPIQGDLGIYGAGDSIAAHVLNDLIRPASSSKGFKLLKYMGWKEGHGIGPRVSAAKRRRLAALQSFGKWQEEPDAERDDEGERHLFPPPDSKLMSFSTKNDRKGLGWTGKSSLNQLLSDVHAKEQPTAAKSLPAFEGIDRDSDEEVDVYSMSEDIRDSTLGKRRKAAPKYGEDGKESAKQPESHIAKSLLKSDPSGNCWHDGRPVLKGFRIASVNAPVDPWFSPSPIPKGWEPDPLRVLGGAQEPGEKDDAGQSSSPGKRVGSNLNPTERGSLLGEARMPGPPPSLSDFLSKAAHLKLKSAGHDALGLNVEKLPLPQEPKATIEVPATDPATARAALQGFMPFGTDLAKQRRYRKYLESQADPQAHPQSSFEPEPGQTREQVNHELKEFFKSANIFRPLSTAMASRFTSASSLSAAKEIQSPAPGLYQPPPAQPKQEERVEAGGKKEEVASEEDLSPGQRAARAGMFGAFTRTVVPWYPVRLLCKRFNVPDPHPDKSGEAPPPGKPGDDPNATVDPFYSSDGRSERFKPGRANETWEANKRQIQHLAESRAWEGPNASGGRMDSALPGSDHVAARKDDDAGEGKSTAEVKIGAAAARSIENVGLGDDETQGQDTLTYVKPPVDIFKAIFASDEEDSEEENERVDGKADAKGPGFSPQANHTSGMQDPTVAFKPCFVPKSRRKREDDRQGEDEEVFPGEKKMKKEKDKKGSSKKEKRKEKPKGMLTFDLEDEGLDSQDPIGVQRSKRKEKGNVGSTPKALETAPAPVSEARAGAEPTMANRAASRPRASDLF